MLKSLEIPFLCVYNKTADFEPRRICAAGKYGCVGGSLFCRRGEGKGMEKLITFAVPCYNSAEYMRHCIDTLLTAGEEAQIVLVDDGSTKDNTAEIADEYAAKYPSIVEVVHKENGGHGSGVNTGIARAKGLYYKVVDSDDWLNPKELSALMERIRKDVAAGKQIDLYLANFVYEKPSENTRHPRRYKKNFPVEKQFGWKDIRPFLFSNVVIMHSMFYRTQVLRDSGLQLPEHTFYVDNIFAFQPLPYVKTMYYMNIDLYEYYIGREDQSVSGQNITKRYRQQMRVTDLMMRAYSYEQIRTFEPRLRRYMLHDINVLMCLTLMFSSNGPKEEIPERKAAVRDMWERLKRDDKKMYSFMRHRSYIACICWMPFRVQRFITRMFYKFYKKVLKCS